MADFDRAVIVGVGLLGGSIGMALRDRGLASQVVGFGRRRESLKLAYELGAVDSFCTELGEACSEADLVLVCTPVQLVPELVLECQQHVKPGALITDVGSTKRTICEHLADTATTTFCGSHPLAGSDRSGVESAERQLLEGKLTVITPAETTPSALVDRTEKLWRDLGSRTVQMSPKEHDEAIARTSHLPHVVAAALAGLTPDELLPLAATGWCDTTRVAAGQVELWTQILQENRGPALAAVREYSDSLQSWLAALETGDAEQLGNLLALGKKKRDTLGN